MKTVDNDEATKQGFLMMAEGLGSISAGMILVLNAEANNSDEETPAPKKTTKPKTTKPKTNAAKAAERAAKKAGTAAKVEAKADDKDGAEEEDDNALTMDDCRNAMIEVIKSHGTTVGRGLLESFDVKKAADLDKSEYADFIEACGNLE